VDPPTLSFGGTSPVSISGTAAGTATLTIATTAPNNCGNAAYQTPRGVFWYTAGGATLVCIMLFGIPARRRRWRLALAMLALLAALMGGLLACAVSARFSSCDALTPGTTPGSYTITVTGTGPTGATTSTSFTLTVQ
jgi:putative copper export protein